MRAAVRADDLLLRCDLARRRHIVSVGATMARQAGKHQPHDVQQLRRSSKGAAYPGHTGALVQRQRRRDVAHFIHARLLRLGHAPPRIRRKRLQIPPRAFSIKHAEGQRRLPRPRYPRNSYNFMQRNIDGDVFQIMHARPPNLNCRRNFTDISFPVFHCSAPISDATFSLTPSFYQRSLKV